MPTRAYVDLMFAWGHARLGDADTARRLMAQAAERFHPRPDAANPYPRADPVHAWLLDAFTFRIEEALANRNHDSPWPEELAERLEAIDERRGLLDKSFRYVIQRMRQQSRILEPNETVDPYLSYRRFGGNPAGRLERWMYRGPVNDLVGDFDAICADAEAEFDPFHLSHFYSLSLNAPRPPAQLIAERAVPRALSFALRVLGEAWESHPDLGRLCRDHSPVEPGGKDPEEWAAYRRDREHPARWIQMSIHGAVAGLFPEAVRMSARVGRPRLVDPYVGDVLRLLASDGVPVTAVRGVCAVLSSLLPVIEEGGFTGEARVLAQRVTDDWMDTTFGNDGWRTIHARLGVAAANLWLGHPSATFAAARSALGQMRNPVRQAKVGCAYLNASVFAPWPQPAQLARELLGVLPRIPNGYTTATHFSRFHLEIAEGILFTCTGPTGIPSTVTETASRREALLDLRARLVEWVERCLDPHAAHPDRARPGHADHP